MTPDLVILGQITIDHVVPAVPSAWHEELGGNALYAAAGARLWCAPDRIGVVARRGPNVPAALEAIMERAGLTTAGLARVAIDNMVEWMIYETDGSRRNLPRNPELRGLRFDHAAGEERYLSRKAAVSATAEDIPPAWLPAGAIHLAPQVLDRHPRSVAALSARTRHLSVDPSPTYSRRCTEAELGRLLHGATALLPSEMEVAHLVVDGDWRGLAARLAAEGFREVAIKLGDRGAAIHDAASGFSGILSACRVTPADLTGAGDAFCGAYMANRLQGEEPAEAARRAIVAAGMVVACSGVEAALSLDPATARERRAAFVDMR